MLKSILFLIKDIEKKCPVNSLKYRNICIWPAVRNGIFFKHISKHGATRYDSENRASQLKKRRYLLLMNKIIFSFGLPALLWVRGCAKPVPKQKIDNLFISQTNTEITINNTTYSPHLDPIITELQASSKTHTICITQYPFYTLKKRYSPTSFPLSLSSCRVKSQLKWRLFKYFKKEIFDTEALAVIEKITEQWPESINTSDIEIYVIEMFECKKAFLSLLKNLSPTNIFFIDYYNSQHQGLILAGKELGIQMIEVQHGLIHALHPMYVEWSKIPAEKYTLMPDTFWCWGKTTQELLTPTNIFKRVVCGGFPWINFFHSQISANTTKEIETFYPKDKTNVLVTLQWGKDFFPQHLFEAIIEAPPDVCWHIRFHPRKRVINKNIEILLNDKEKYAIETSISNSSEIHALLPHVDIVLTGYSTTGIEAMLYGIPVVYFHETILADENSNFIDSQDTFWASTKKELLNIIASCSKRPKKSSGLASNQHISIDHSTMTKALKIISSEPAK
jgi:hypothetical protein